jgi:hypothetical protein
MLTPTASGVASIDWVVPPRMRGEVRRPVTRAASGPGIRTRHSEPLAVISLPRGAQIVAIASLVIGVGGGIWMASAAANATDRAGGILLAVAMILAVASAFRVRAELFADRIVNRGLFGNRGGVQLDEIESAWMETSSSGEGGRSTKLYVRTAEKEIAIIAASYSIVQRDDFAAALRDAVSAVRRHH